MIKALNKKTITILKFALSIGVLIIVITKLSEFTKTQPVSLTIFSTLTLNNWNYLLVALFLMPLNWSLETYKWHLAKHDFNCTSFLTSLKQVLAGISISVLTPNRNGEFIGRVGLLPKEERIKGLETYFALSLSQQFFTVLFGVISLTILNLPFILWGILILLILIALIFLFNRLLPKISEYLSKKIKLNFLKSIEKELLIQLVSLSGLRYLIFWFQYFLLLKGFNAQGENYLLFMAIPSIFFIGSYVPSFALAEMGVKTLVALYCLSSISNQNTPIIFASMLLWIVNVGIPALAGIYPLLTSKTND